MNRAFYVAMTDRSLIQTTLKAQPLVSCIMPTANRRPFVPQAIDYFLQQEYPQRELIIINDGSDSVADLIPKDARIRYLRLDNKCTIGSKRNYACEEAKGDLIAHWDDDDWMASWRLTYQIEHLLAEQADITGLNNPLFYNPQTKQAWQYKHPPTNQAWLYGATFLYTKSLRG